MMSPRWLLFKKSGMITSTHNAKIQLVRNLLGRSKERRQSGAFVAEGVRLVEEALASGRSIRFVLAGKTLNERGSALAANLRAQHVDVETVANPIFASIGDTETSQGILAVLDQFQLLLPHPLSFVLIPDQVRDPGNLGTLLRAASAAGVEAVFIPPETTDAFAPKVVRAGMGAHFHLPIHTLGWEQISPLVSGLEVYLADMEGTPFWETNLHPPLALIVGGEAAGASLPARALGKGIISIPMPGRAESLNAAMAGAILMFEVVRQRSVK